MKNRVKKIIVLGLMTLSIMAIGSIGVNAEWRNNNGNWNYLKADGTKATGWLKSTDNKWYYLGTDGIMLSNKWLNDNGKWYYLGNNGEWNENINNDTNTIIIPPSTWRKLDDNQYAINNRSIISYSVEDMTGWTQESVMNGIRKVAYKSGNYDSNMELVTFNGNNGYAYSYTSVIQNEMRKTLYIVMFKNNKHYDFILMSNYNSYDTDRKELENVLNSSLVLN